MEMDETIYTRLQVLLGDLTSLPGYLLGSAEGYSTTVEVIPLTENANDSFVVALQRIEQNCDNQIIIRINPKQQRAEALSYKDGTTYQVAYPQSLNPDRDVQNPLNQTLDQWLEELLEGEYTFEEFLSENITYIIRDFVRQECSVWGAILSDLDCDEVIAEVARLAKQGKFHHTGVYWIANRLVAEGRINPKFS